MKRSWLGWAALSLAACGGAPPAPQGVKIAPNETPPQALAPAPVEELTSTAEILQQIRERMAAQAAESQPAEPEASAQPDGPPAEASRPPDLETMTPDPQAGAARAFYNRFFPPPAATPGDAGDPRPDHNGFRIGPPPRPDLRTLAGAAAEPAAAPTRRAQPPGGRLFPPRARTADAGPSPTAGDLIPPGRFFRARLLGNATVSLVSPAVLATLLDPEGRPIGLAVGSATLTRGDPRRALLTFQDIHLDDGRSIKGNLAAFDLDFAQGLRGRVERQTFRQFINALTHAVFAALSLEVETGDGFADVFKFNLAGKLLDQAGREFGKAELARRVHLARGTLFWVASLQELSVREQAYAQAIDSVADKARDAFQKTLLSAPVDPGRREALSQAFARLHDRLGAFAPAPDPSAAFRQPLKDD